MPKSRQVVIIFSILFFSTFLATIPQSFSTHSQKTKVTITIYPNENIEDEDNDDQGEDNNTQSESIQVTPQPFNLLNWLKSLFR